MCSVQLEFDAKKANHKHTPIDQKLPRLYVTDTMICLVLDQIPAYDVRLPQTAPAKVKGIQRVYSFLWNPSLRRGKLRDARAGQGSPCTPSARHWAWAGSRLDFGLDWARFSAVHVHVNLQLSPPSLTPSHGPCRCLLCDWQAGPSAKRRAGSGWGASSRIAIVGGG